MTFAYATCWSWETGEKNRLRARQTNEAYELSFKNEYFKVFFKKTPQASLFGFSPV